MTKLNFRQLIDLAIGSPEPGHVNFYALHCVLYSFADKLNITEKTVNYDKYSTDSIIFSEKRCDDLHLKRITGGAELGENAAEAPSQEAIVAEEPVETEAIEIPVEAQPSEPQPSEPQPSEPQVEVPNEEEAVVEVKSQEQQPRLEAPTVPEVKQLEPIVEEVEVQDVQPITPIKSSKSIVSRNSALVEIAVISTNTNDDLTKGLAIMKDQLELAIEQLLNLTSLAISGKIPTGLRLDIMRNLSTQLHSIQKENIFIESTHRFTAFKGSSPDVAEYELEEAEEDDFAEGVELQSQLSQKGAETPVKEVYPTDFDIDMHLCYSPQKMLDELLELKSEFCSLTNKINEISATIIEQDCQRTMMMVQDLQDQMREVKFTTSGLKESQERVENKQIRSNESMEAIMKVINDIVTDKIDRSEIDILLADKVDYSQLQRKVSHEQIKEMQCRLDKQFCEVKKVIALNEKNMAQVVDNMRATLGLDTIDELLRKFKDKIEVDIANLREILRKSLELTNDDCAAAGARIKVLQDLACISCDTTCVMRTRERSKVAKLPNARASALLSPLITYELGSIRKSGIMGYYRKDEFPHAPNAWMGRQAGGMKACVPRHAGGPHTTHTAKDHVEKVLQNKK